MPIEKIVTRHNDSFLKFESDFRNAMDTYQARRNITNDGFAKFDAAVGFSDKALSKIHADEIMLTATRRFDAGEASFFARQLEFIKAKTYDVKYPLTLAQTIIPVSAEAGPGAKTITYRQYNTVGEAAPIGHNASDLPRVDTFGKEFPYMVQPFGLSYGYTLDEIRESMFGNVPLEQRKANAARDIYERTINKYGWFADGSSSFAGLSGLIYNSDVQHLTALNGAWLTNLGALSLTTDQIINDVNDAITKVMTNTLGIHQADTVLLPLAHYAIIARTPRSTISDTTVLQFLKDNNPGVSFYAINELSSAYVTKKPSDGTSTPVNLCIAFERNPDVLTYEIPQPFEQLPVQERGLEFIIPCHYRASSVIAYYPRAISIKEGI
jgi:hypothetical protein